MEGAMAREAVQRAASSANQEATAWDEAADRLGNAARIWEEKNVSAIVAGFTEDCVVRYADLPIFRGRAALAKFLDARFRRAKDYKIEKTLLVTHENRTANS